VYRDQLLALGIVPSDMDSATKALMILANKLLEK
jgi:hypothetical protein